MTVEAPACSRRAALGSLLRGAALLGAAQLGAAPLAACRGSSSARPDGRLVVYAAGPRPLAASLASLYQERSGTTVDLFTATTGQILAKVEAERLNPRADVLILASSLAAEWLRRERRLLQLDLADAVIARHPERLWDDPHGCFVATGAACVGIAARPGWTRGTRSWASMLDGGFVDESGRPGKVVIPSPARSGTSGDFVVQWTLEEGERAWRLLTDARRRGRLEVKGANSEALDGLRKGETQAVMAAVDYLVCDAIDRGVPITLTFPVEGAPVVTRPACILRSTRRPAAARAFINHLLGPEAQQLVAGANLIPVGAGVDLSPTRAALGIPRPMPLDLDRAMADQRMILRRFQYEVERLVVSS